MDGDGLGVDVRVFYCEGRRYFPLLQEGVGGGQRNPPP